MDLETSVIIHFHVSMMGLDGLWTKFIAERGMEMGLQLGLVQGRPISSAVRRKH